MSCRAVFFSESKLCRLSHFWGTFWDIWVLHLDQFFTMKTTSPKHGLFAFCRRQQVGTQHWTFRSSFHPLPHSFLWRCTIGIFRALRSPEYVTLFWLLGSWNVFLVGQIRKLRLCIDDPQKPDLRGCKIARRMYASLRSFSTELYRSAKWEKKPFPHPFTPKA